MLQYILNFMGVLALGLINFLLIIGPSIVIWRISDYRRMRNERQGD